MYSSILLSPQQVQFQPQGDVGGQNAFEIKHDKRNARGYDYRPKGYHQPVF
jgi:hypothetical protein